MYQVFCAATGQAEQQEQVEQYKESVLELDATKKILPFRLALDENTQYLYQPSKFSVETNTPLNSQPATLQSLVSHSNFLDIQNINERLNLIVNQAREICQVTEARFIECDDKKNKRVTIQSAKDTLVTFIREKTFKNYCDIIEELSNSFSSNSQYVNDLSFESIKDELTQNKTVNNYDLMTALKLDEKMLSNLITTVKSQQQMINLNQSKTYILEQLNEISGKDEEQVEELSSLDQRMQSLIQHQREKIQTLIAEYDSVKLTNDDLQLYSFEYQARNLHEEILTIENNARENQSIYLLKDYAFRVLLNQQMLKVCERTTLILLMMRFFNQSKEGGALEKLVFLSKLPDINRQLMDEIVNRRDNFSENVLIKTFRNFIESIKQACQDENDRRDHVEKNAIGNLSDIQIQELKSIIPGIVGERIPINLIIEGLAKLERSVSRTIDSHLPQSNLGENEENDFFLISKPSENLTQSTYDLSNMTMSSLIDYTERKTEALSNPHLVYHNIDNEVVDEVPTQLYQSVVQQPSEDYSQLQNTILMLKKEVESLNAKLKECDTQLIKRENTIEEQMHSIRNLERDLTENTQSIQSLNSTIEALTIEKDTSIQTLSNTIEELTIKVEQSEREKLLSSGEHSESVSLLKTTLSQLEISKKDLQDKLIKMATEFSKLDQLTKNQNQEIQAKEEQLLLLSKSVQDSEGHTEKLKQEIETVNEKYEQQFLNLMISEKKVETLQESINCLTQKYSDCQNELNIVKEERLLVEKNLRVKVDELTQDLNDLSETNNQLSKKLSDLSNELSSTTSKLENFSQELFNEHQKSRDSDIKLKVEEETKKVLQEKLFISEGKLANSQDEIVRLKNELDNVRFLLEEAKTQSSIIQPPTITTNNDDNEKLKKEVKELTIKAQMYETATLKSAGAVTNLQKKIQEQQIALKEQEDTLKFLQDQYSQLEKSYMQVQSGTQPKGKTYVSLEPELNDIVIFFKGNTKDIFTAISKNANRIMIAPESIGTLKERYGDAFDKLNIVVGKIVYLEQSNPSYNPFNLNTPYATAFIEELL